ncbi:MAG: hypothetical protein IPL79_15020 [Myxococcales bacterium]|nr:hypothetical protein [Myxococcales bacterium]
MLVLPLLICTGACINRDIAKVPPKQDKVEVKRIPVKINRNIDILWVVDSSKSMDGEQAALIANFPAFIGVLESIKGGLPNVQMGVISTDGRDIGGGGGNCGGGGGTLKAPAGKSPFITDILPEGAPARSNSWEADGYASLAAAFSAYATNIGTSGCGFEQHFQSVIDAVAPAANPGFIREDAFLAVIFLTDEDDCSAALGNNDLYGGTPQAPGPLGPRSSYRCWQYGVHCEGDAADNERLPGVRRNCELDADSPYTMGLDTVIDALETAKRKRQLIIASIQGDTDVDNVSIIQTPAAWGPPGTPENPPESSPVTMAPSCVQPGAPDVYADAGGQDFIARPAVRLKALLDTYPNRSSSQSICAGDLTPALTQIANLLKEVVGNPCILGDLKDADPNTAGLQPDCQVSIITNDGEPDQSEEILPECSPSITTNCWKLETDAVQCDETDHHLILVIEREETETDNLKTFVAGCVLN